MLDGEEADKPTSNLMVLQRLKCERQRRTNTSWNGTATPDSESRRRQEERERGQQRGEQRGREKTESNQLEAETLQVPTHLKADKKDLELASLTVNRPQPVEKNNQEAMGRTGHPGSSKHEKRCRRRTAARQEGR